MWVVFHIAEPFSQKVRHGIRGRAETWKSIQDFLQKVKGNAAPLIVFHSASLGEYEQIRPILADLKKDHPDWKLVVTFFSPSGFEHFKRTESVDLAIYLPFASLRSVNRFLKALHPGAIVITKHDIWPNLIWAANRRKIPTMLINGTLPADSAILRFPVSGFYRQVYSRISTIHPASETDRQQFLKVGAAHSLREVLGDTRFDQVLNRAEESKTGKFFPEEWKSVPFIFVAGSTWPSDEARLIPAVIDFYRENSGSRFIIVPHEPTPEHIEPLLKQFAKDRISVKLYSEWQKNGLLENVRVIVVDQIGILANLYAFSDMAYVGGSFDPGVHNVMEPAASSNVVLFGPKILNSPEAQELVRRSVGFVVRSQEEILEKLREFSSDSNRSKLLQEGARSVVVENAGATRQIVRSIEQIVSKKQFHDRR